VELRGAFDAVLDCAACRKAPRTFELARAPWRYDGLAQTAVRRFKYERRWRLGRWLAEGMARTAQTSLPLEEVAAVVPVPLHWLKRRLAGGNPAEELARAVSQRLGAPCLPQALVRTRWTATQTRLSWSQRARNVREAFTAFPAAVRDRTVLLVDDVLTSGATADACARALKQAGARRVFVLTAARTPLEAGGWRLEASTSSLEPRASSRS
jgi:ComF family protein